MKRTFKRLAALTAMGFTLGTSVYAQPLEDGPGWGAERMEHHRAQMAKIHERRLTALKAKLQLTPDQEAAWNNFARAHQPPSVARWPHADREALAKLRTPERLDEVQKQFEAHHNAMQSHMRQVEGATRQFYALLTPEQQKVFDAETLPPSGSPHGREPKARP
jgi:protein CpxP